MKSHAAVAAVLLGSEELVEQVLRDIDSSSLTDAEKLLMHLLDKVNHDSPSITPADIVPLHAAGWTPQWTNDAALRSHLAEGGPGGRAGAYTAAGATVALLGTAALVRQARRRRRGL